MTKLLTPWKSFRRKKETVPYFILFYGDDYLNDEDDNRINKKQEQNAADHFQAWHIVQNLTCFLFTKVTVKAKAMEKFGIEERTAFIEWMQMGKSKD